MVAPLTTATSARTTRRRSSLPRSDEKRPLADLSDDRLNELLKTMPWRFLRRENQTPPPGDWFAWLILAGRGFGKTRTGAEYIAEALTTNENWRAALVAATFPDGRDTMVEGESGLLSVLPASALRGGTIDEAWNRSIGELHLANGSRARIYTSERPRQLRGPQHHVAWGDEPAHWDDANSGDEEGTTWSNLKLGLRLGDHPRVVLTTTPRPVRLLTGGPGKIGLLADSGVVVTRGSSYENLENLSFTFEDQVLAHYKGTRIGRQELYAELLEDVEGALWTLALIDANRRPAPAILRHGVVENDLVRVVVAIDPAVTVSETSDETGIVVAGIGHDGRGYILEDRSTKAHPLDWAQRAIAAFDEFGADRIVAEVNNGGDMVETVLRTVRPTIPFRALHASRGKRTRAEPIAALYEQGRVSHTKPLPELEDQLCSFTPESGQSPDRLDALVWALTDLMLSPTVTGGFSLVA